MSLFDLSSIGNVAVVLATVAASAVSAWLTIKAAMRRERRAVQLDKEKLTFIERLIKERDDAVVDARTARATRMSDATLIARLTLQRDKARRERDAVLADHPDGARLHAMLVTQPAALDELHTGWQDFSLVEPGLEVQR